MAVGVPPAGEIPEEKISMTNDDHKTDHFIREVDEELRREQITTLWQRYGKYLIAACVLVVLATAGLRGWDWWREREAARIGDLYLAADQLVTEEDNSEAIKAFEAIATSEKGGYSAIAGLRAATLKITSGDKAGAIALYDKIAGDGRVDDILQDLARLRAAYLALDEDDMDGAASRVSKLAVTGNPWRHGAREVLGLVALDKGDNDAALSHFADIERDEEAPSDIRARATALLAVLQGAALPAKTPDAAQPDSAAGNQ